MNEFVFIEIKSNRMTFNENGKLDRIIGTKFDFKGKASYIEKISNELNIKPYEILFVGNSNNDQLAYTSGAVTLCVNPRLTDPFEDKKWNNTINDMQNLDEILKYINLSKLSL
jgi:phosphoserine phosphatase